MFPLSRNAENAPHSILIKINTNGLYLYSPCLVIVDHSKCFTPRVLHSPIHTHIQGQFGVQCLAQRHLDVLMAGSGI